MCVVAREAVRAPVAVGGVVWACTAQPARACQAVHGAWGPVRFRGCVDLCLCSVPRHVGTCVLEGGPYVWVLWASVYSPSGAVCISVSEGV